LDQVSSHSKIREASSHNEAVPGLLLHENPVSQPTR